MLSFPQSCNNNTFPDLSKDESTEVTKLINEYKLLTMPTSASNPNRKTGKLWYVALAIGLIVTGSLIKYNIKTEFEPAHLVGYLIGCGVICASIYAIINRVP